MRADTFDDKVPAKAVQALNRHLPVGRKTLFALLNEDKPAVQTRDNSLHRIKREELTFIANLVRKEDCGTLRLPLYIESTPDYGRGIARVRGKPDCEVVNRVLGKEHDDADELFIHRNDIRKARRTLQTTTLYTFLYSTSF